MDVRDADLVVGTSAGSVVAAQISSGVPLAELAAAELAAPAEPPADRGSRSMGPASVRRWRPSS